MAKVLVEYSLGVQPGWILTIHGAVPAAPLIRSVYREALRVGAHPFVLLEAPGVEELMLAYGSEEQLTRTNPYILQMVEQSDAVLRIQGEENTRSTNGVDPARL